MPLASKDGKLYFKTVTEIVDGKEVEVLKLCSSCCGTAPPDPIGCCYTYSYDNSGNPVFITSKDTQSNCAAIQEQVDPSFDVVWYPSDESQTCESGCYEYEEYFQTDAEAEESWGQNYAPYGWSREGGKNFYDPDTDQWKYKAVCCKELNYDDQGQEWCGPITRSNPLP